jgi:hypothetical protein
LDSLFHYDKVSVKKGQLQPRHPNAAPIMGQPIQYSYQEPSWWQKVWRFLKGDGLKTLEGIPPGKLLIGAAAAIRNADKLSDVAKALEKGAAVGDDAVRASLRGAEEVAKKALSVEGKALLNANPIGSALKADKDHLAATFMREEAAVNGTNFAIEGGDGAIRTLTQLPGELNGVAGRYEYLVDGFNNLTHQRFIRGGSINGIPNKP